MIKLFGEALIVSLSLIGTLYATTQILGSVLDREHQFTAERLEPYLEAEKQFQYEQAREQDRLEAQYEEQLNGHCY